MSEHERGESRWLGPFLLGVLVGVLLTLGGSATFFMVVQGRGAMRMAVAAEEADRARAEAEAAREMAERARDAERRAMEAERAMRQKAEKALREDGKADKKQDEQKDAKKDEKDQEARRGVKTLDTAIKAYKVANGDWPATLDVMTVPQGNRPASLEKAALLDPWGRAYVYEAAKRNPKTNMPLVYSLGPDPENADGRIRNW